jgi:hypothetical protein
VKNVKAFVEGEREEAGDISTLKLLELQKKRRNPNFNGNSKFKNIQISKVR